MNEFTRKESELVDSIIGDIACGLDANRVYGIAWAGVTKYAQVLDWEAAATAVIELVKERLSKQ